VYGFVPDHCVQIPLLRLTLSCWLRDLVSFGSDRFVFFTHFWLRRKGYVSADKVGCSNIPIFG
jgi:hypothetical protein